MFEYDVTLAGTVDTDTHRIARGLRRRDVALLHALVGQYQYRLVRYFTHLLGRSDPVDDLVQETWLRVLERGSSYDGRSRFEPWLFTVARNLAIDHLRKQRVFSLDSNDSPEQDLEPLLPVCNAPSPFELAARTEDAQRLTSSLQQLHPVYREALVLRFQEDLSLQEIADVLRTSVSTVASRIYRGLAALRAQLEGKENANG
jgi:RNA polymerase sigma-70 factor (ECF subfamily)